MSTDDRFLHIVSGHSNPRRECVKEPFSLCQPFRL